MKTNHLRVAPRFQVNEAQAYNITKIKEFFASQPDGAECLWPDIEQATAVACIDSPYGRSLVTRALNEARRPFLHIRGLGVRLTTRADCGLVAVGKYRGVIRAGNRAKKACDAILAHHGDITVDAKKQVMGVIGFHGAMRSLASSTNIVKK